MTFETRAALFAWLEAHGLTHVARFNLEAVAPGIDPSLWKQLRALGARRRLTDLGCEESIARSKEWLAPSPLRDVLPGVVAAFIENEKVAAERARTEVAERIALPTSLGGNGVHARLLELRQRVPDSVAPRVNEALRVEDLTLERALPGFRFKDLLPTEQALRSGGGFGRAEVKLTLLDGALRFDCTCGMSPCVHVLAAIDTALVWLRSAPAKDLEELARPAWQRTLAKLDAALATSTPVATGAEVQWRLQITEELHVTAWVGDRAVSRKELLHFALPLLDSHLAPLLPDDDEPASRALLEGLIDHPRAVLDRAPELAVRIERAQVGLVAEERLGSVRVSAGLEGAALPPYLADRVRRAEPEELLFLWDEGPRQLTLLDVKPELRELLGVLQKENAVFPPESHGALLESLSKWAQRLPVAMPRSVLGESVPPTLLAVLRLEARPKGAVELEVRIRALPDAAAMLPGSGPRDVHLRRGEKAVHAVRDLKAEVAFAEALCNELPLSKAEVLEDFPFHFRFEHAEDALTLVDASARRSIAPELEWVGTPLRSLGGTGPRALKVTVKNDLEWFGVLGSLSVEGERVELARLLDAARRKSRWVQVEAHTYVELNEVLRRHLERVADHVHVTKQGLLVGPAATEALKSLEAAGATLEADAAWEKLADRIEGARKLEPKLPRGLKAKLRPYQLEGYQWLSRLAAMGAGAVLADDMGLGKTVQALTLLLSRASEGPALVVAPTSVAFNWKEEAERFAPSLKLHLYADLDDRAQTLGPGDVLVMSYGLLVRDAKQLASRQFATVVFDEAQNLKNAHTQRFLAAKALKAEFRVALSGTPIENHLGELWALFALVFPPLLSNWESFRARFAIPIETQTDPTAAPALGRILEPFLLRRTKAEVETELPLRTEVRVPVVLSTPEWELYEDTRLAALSDLETPKRVMKDQERRVQVLALLTRLRLVASHPRLHVENSQIVSSKLSRLLELIDELRAEGQRALVFSQFTSHLALVREALDERRIGYVELDGSTPRKVRTERVREFQDGNAPIFLLSLKAGGVGLNLTAATNVIHLDPWWNPAVEDQASDRAHRLGQKRPVTIYRLIAMGTVEEQMLTLHERKRALIAGVLSGKSQAGKLGTDQLIALLRASPATSE
ncbi:MAG: DEAD/DEAH box helicase [Archangium sp.]|nr:DEAD/DEAH box helicase [Archangium sp.]